MLKKLVDLRERLRPYIEKHMEIASQKGIPVMRPMFFEYPDDEICYKTGGQYMFGDDILLAPIVNRGQTEKEVYLPKGDWIFARDNFHYEGGGKYTVTAEIDEIIVFVKQGAEIISALSANN